jgi:20S proteasome alpha/beta subunit
MCSSYTATEGSASTAASFAGSIQSKFFVAIGSAANKQMQMLQDDNYKWHDAVTKRASIVVSSKNLAAAVRSYYTGVAERLS